MSEPVAVARRPVLLFAVKAFHSLAFFVIQSSILYLIYSGARRRSDRRAMVAATIATSETAIYALNGFRCPLTGLAERRRARRHHGYLPAEVARR